MARRDSFPADRSLAFARRILRFLVFTTAICVGIGLSVLVLVGTLVSMRAVTDSRTFGSLVALLVFGMAVALPVYWLVVRDRADGPR